MAIMTSQEATYWSAAQVKQQMPTVSKRYISRVLKQSGWRYRRIRHTPPPRKFSPAEIRRVVRFCLPAFAKDSESLLFLDEVLFPLNLTPKSVWRHKDQPFTGFKERTACKRFITCLALCSKTRVIAIQMTEASMDSEALIYFLTEALKLEELPDRVAVLLDNARYHTSVLVRRSSIGQFLVKNVTRCYELNMIEMVFSKVKHLWKLRPTVATIEEEVQQIVQIFRQCQLPQDFAGYRRNYLRNAKLMLQLAKESTLTT